MKIYYATPALYAPVPPPSCFSSHELACLTRADLVIVDCGDRVIGGPEEVSILGRAKEIFDRRVITIASNPLTRDNPLLRRYSDYIVTTGEEASSLANKLEAFSLSPRMSEWSSEQKSGATRQIKRMSVKSSIRSLALLLPTELKRRWRILFGDEYKQVLKRSFMPLPKTVRVNGLLSSRSEFSAIANKYGWQLRKVDLSPVVYRLPRKLGADFPKIVESGKIYVQELASMLPAFALDPQPGEDILDIAAAPGSKTSQMADMMKNGGTILASDICAERVDQLAGVVERCGIRNVSVVLSDGRGLGALYPNAFDRVMVDVPCSCEGIIRFRPHKIFEWSPYNLDRLTDIQRGLILSGFDALKPGGVMVYSTCTYAPEENEAIVDHVLKERANSVIETMSFVGIVVREGLTSWEGQRFDDSLVRTARIYPQDNNTIGFYIAKIRKV